MSLLHVSNVITTYLNYYMTTRPRALQPGLQGLLLVITRTRSGKSINVERLEHASIQLAARLRISRRREMLLQLRDFIIILRVTSPLCVPCEISCRPRPDHDHRFDSRPTSLRVRKPLSSLSRMSKPMLYSFCVMRPLLFNGSSLVAQAQELQTVRPRRKGRPCP